MPKISFTDSKIFIFIWFWMCFVGFFSCFSFLLWLYKFTGRSRVDFIRKYLNIRIRLDFDNRSSFSKTKEASVKELDNFVFGYLKQDGIFLLRVIKRTKNEIVLSELLHILWKNFKKSSHHNDP